MNEPITGHLLFGVVDGSKQSSALAGRGVATRIIADVATNASTPAIARRIFMAKSP
jgi:hypothetical protein